METFEAGSGNGSGSLVKISRPRLVDVYRRERLFDLLDVACARPVVWVMGPPGAGKTMLVASYLKARKLGGLWYQLDEGDQDLSTLFYFLGLAARKAAPDRPPLPLLTPEYLMDVRGFTRRFFRSLFDGLRRPSVVVLEDYQNVPAESVFHEMMRLALGEVPEGCHVIIMSRRVPPRDFAYFEANGKLAAIGWPELRLRDDEAIGIVSLRRQNDLLTAALPRLVAKAQGWAAGLVLLLEWVKTESVEPEALDALVPETLRDYFTTEVLQSLAPHAEHFLYRTALLPKVTTSMATALTGEARAASILAQLVRRNNFVTRHFGRETVYQYHALFREFLLYRAPEVLGHETWSTLQRRTAEVLEQAGELVSSARYCRVLEDWAGVARTLSRVAPSLLAEGRNQTVLSLLQDIPGSAREQWPVLDYWQGMALMHLDPLAALRAFEMAYGQLKQSGDVELRYSVWCGVVESHWFARNEVHALGFWLQEFRELNRCYPSLNSPALETRALVSVYVAMALCRLDDPEILEWEQRILKLVDGQLPRAQRLMASSALMLRNTWFGGGHRTARVVLDTVETLLRSEDISAVEEIMALFCRCLYAYCFIGSTEACLAAAEEGLKKAAEHGIHIMDTVLIVLKIYAYLAEERLTEAQTLLGSQPELRNTQLKYELYGYHFMSANELWLGQRFQQALEQANFAYQAAAECGQQVAYAYTHAGLAQIYRSQGDRGKAFSHLALARHQAKKCGIHNIEYVCWLLDALLALERGQRTRCRHFLRRALAIGRETGYVRLPFLRRLDLARLCAVALEAEIEPHTVRTLVRERELMLEEPRYRRMERWPWQLRLRCLGDLEILKDEAPLAFSRKAPKKPLELLKAVVAYGGKNVPESWLLDTLWPAEEADAAKQSFNMALSRLRKLVGNQTLLLQQGRLGLNPACSWVDVWVFESLLRQAAVGRKTEWSQHRVRLLQKALALYRGHFLAKDTEAPWAMAPRERLRRRFIQTVAELGGYFEQRQAWEECLECYRHGLEVDEYAETFYQGLMRAYQQLGQTAQALDTYYRCKRFFAVTLDSKPSTATEALFQAITSN